MIVDFNWFRLKTNSVPQITTVDVSLNLEVSIYPKSGYAKLGSASKFQQTRRVPWKPRHSVLNLINL
jgi:hypothetical protein